MCVSSRTAQAEEPSEQGEGGDDEDQAWFVCPFRVCSEVASKAARRDVEEQAASAQTTDLVEDAPKASERAVGLRFCSLKSHCILWPLPLLVQGEQLQKTALEKNQAPAKTANRCVRLRQSMAKHPCTRQDPAQAQQVLLDVLQKQLQMAANTTATVQNRWQKEFNAQNDQEAGALWEQLAEANQQVDKVMQKLEAARASVQAGPGQAGLLHVQLLLLPLICTPAWSSFPCGPPCFAFWGHALISARIPSSSSCLHCVHWGLFGVEGLLAASGFIKKCGCTCFTAWKRHLCGSGKGVTQI